jgi:hypothetical protein
MTENMNFAQIRDYYSDETVEKIVELLHEYQGMLPMKFLEMKGIAGDLGEMNIPLKPGVKSV